MTNYVNNQNTQKEMQKRMSGPGVNANGGNGVGLRNNNFMRPSSANAKRKDGGQGASNDGGFDTNLRHLMISNG